MLGQFKVIKVNSELGYTMIKQAEFKLREKSLTVLYFSRKQTRLVQSD